MFSCQNCFFSTSNSLIDQKIKQQIIVLSGRYQDDADLYQIWSIRLATGHSYDAANALI